MDKKRKSSIDLSTTVYGKVPPQARDVERDILGNCLDDPNAFLLANEMLTPECFYADPHQRIFRAMITLNNRNSPIDVLTVIEQLKTTEDLEAVGGAHEITKINQTIVKKISEAHCMIVLEKFMKREMIRLSGETLGQAYEDETDIFEMMDKHEKELTAISTKTTQNKLKNIDEAIVENLTIIHNLRNIGSSITGVPSGFQDLDAITHGWQDTDLIILAARPSVGKTAFALNLARNAARGQRGTVAFFSLEMSRRQLVNRILSSESGISLENITNGKLTDYEMEKLQTEAVNVSRESILIDDTPSITLYQLRSKLRSIKRKKKLILAVVDYLQLMSGTGDNKNREQDIATISRGLKGLGKELNIPIIALSQLSRKVEDRKQGDKMPQLSDLRESGAIEQDADAVMFMYRPEYYDQTSDAFGESNRGETHIKIAKHRNGRVNEIVKLFANLSIQKFNNWNYHPDKPAGLPSNWTPVKNITEDMFTI